MGTTICSKSFSCDLGCFGFYEFRNLVAEKISKNFHEHYMHIYDVSVMFNYGEKRYEYFKKHNSIRDEFIKNGEISIDVANFLYQNGNGEINSKTAIQIFELIKECNDQIVFGYQGNLEYAKMSDLKNIFSDGSEVKWVWEK